MSNTEAEAVEEMVLAGIDNNRAPFIIDGPNDRKFIAQPVDDGAWATEEILPRPNEGPVFLPKHITQAVQLQTLPSLVEYVNRFQNEDSVLFADIAANRILAIIDYHKEPGAAESRITPPEAQHTKHTAALTLPFSVEWQTWTGIDGRLMSHVDFATFLEENAMDVLPLAPAKDAGGNPIEDAPTTLLELCREMQLKGSYGAVSTVRNGDYNYIEMQKGDDITTKRGLVVPQSFGLQLPVYFNEQAVPITAFLRKSSTDGVLRLGIKLQRPDNVRQDEFHRIVGEVANDVELTTLYGKPA